MRSSQILSQNLDLSLPHVHSTPPLGGGVRQNIATTFGTEKNRMVWLPEGEKKLEDMFSRFDRMHVRT